MAKERQLCSANGFGGGMLNKKDNSGVLNLKE